MDKILVIIVVYNGMQWLKRCLDSVDSPDVDVFIVDNCSTDGSQAFIKANYCGMHFIESKENLGFGAANNMGLRYAYDNGYDYVYLLNQDAWIFPDTLKTMIEAQKKQPKYGILSPMQMRADLEAMDGFFARSMKRSLHRGNTLDNEIVEMKFIMAAHWLISRECFSKVGVFSPVFYHYGEDNNYLHRTKYFGFKIGAVPKAKAVHDRAKRKVSVEKRAYLVVNMFLKYSSDINKPYLIALFKGYYKLYRNALRLAKKFKDRSLFYNITSEKFDLKMIRADRKKNKKACIWDKV